MIKKQKTFENSTYRADEDAIEWLLKLSRVFDIKSAKVVSYTKKGVWTSTRYCTRVEVQYE